MIGLRRDALLRHVIESQQFNRDVLEQVFRSSDEMRAVAARGGNDSTGPSGDGYPVLRAPVPARGSPSRRRLYRLGGHVITTGECPGVLVSHQGRDAGGYGAGGGLVCGRAGDPPLRGAARPGAPPPSRRLPVINAADGPGPAPHARRCSTLYTIRAELGPVGRAARRHGGRSQLWPYGALAELLAGALSGDRADLRGAARCGDALRISRRTCGAPRRGLYREERDLKVVLAGCDVIYQTRIQKERFADRPGDYEAAARRLHHRWRGDGSVSPPMPL